ncbi:MAG: hypothetical protein LBP35_03330 [Candidatus Ancillula trichonymphae]|jgi:hypothetical protein|nr:hypothetical protein [Candidatus Ancillula trichonymphae]
MRGLAETSSEFSARCYAFNIVLQQLPKYEILDNTSDENTVVQPILLVVKGQRPRVVGSLENAAQALHILPGVPLNETISVRNSAAHFGVRLCR